MLIDGEIRATEGTPMLYFWAPTLSTTDPRSIKRAIDMTDDELAAIASGAKLHVVK